MPPSSTPAAPAEPATAPQATERLVALGAVLEERGDDREGGRGDDRRAETLGRASGDQLALIGGETRGERGDGHDEQARHEDAPAPEQVGRTTTEQQEAAERDHVRVDDPRQVLLGEVKAPADAGQRDVDDRRVEDDDELRHAEQDQGGPPAVEIFLVRFHSRFLLCL